MSHLNAIFEMIRMTAPYWGVFAAALVVSLFLTPVVRDFNRRIGIVDNPDARRVNKTPIPRGGGVAVIAAFSFATAALMLFFGKPVSPVIKNAIFWRMMALSIGIGTS